ncbi:MAG: UDP-N-acetylmuramate: L-alanyl-gamma-D-glutamyl-meso-diaminopimelate ligase [Flavobacteriales bacterium]|jgi:UDP-N-acetylmuramate: L-alanyl-gamma-D-glutamyl-meso-diaminopimelate ligase
MAIHIHILGIAGTFMGSLAQLAKEAGFRVTGCDTAVYPPMSQQLDEAGIDFIEGFDISQLALGADVYIIGNAISRGNALLEAILNRGLSYMSGPQWLAEHVLKGKWVLAVAGTHGKTTTTSMLAWILEYAGMQPGYLIGGVAQNFSRSARLGASDFFVIEADEYDTAFFDKRSKFVHYMPRTLILNNLEFDHADIFPDLMAIQRQFHHLIRTVPQLGLVISPQDDTAIQDALAQGCWTPQQFSVLADIDTPSSSPDTWRYELLSPDGSSFRLTLGGQDACELHWDLSGIHNVTNAVHAIAAARNVGVHPATACEALQSFKGVRRRMELLGGASGVDVYDDFAHHPTAIRSTLDGLRKRVGEERKIIAVIEPRSNTMRLGVHKNALNEAVESADKTLWYSPAGLDWNLHESIDTGLENGSGRSEIYDNCDEILTRLESLVEPGASCVVMSNGGFEAMPSRIAARFVDIENAKRAE